MSRLEPRARSATVEDLRQEFIQFREECIWLRQCHKNYADLFEQGDDVLTLLGTSAVHFFQDLNRVLIEYQWIVCARILDPAISIGRPNLTVLHINDALNELALLSPPIEAATAGLTRYRDILREARNRLIAHLDLEAVMAGEARGVHEEADIQAFHQDLQTYLDEVGRALGEGPLDISPSGASGDALDLLRVLRQQARSSKSVSGGSKAS